MQIIHRIEDFLFELFPNIKNAPDKNSALKEELIRFYTIDDNIPTVEIENGWVIITITNPVQQQDADFKRAVSLCEKKMFSQAKDILNKLIQNNKTNSEYFRIYVIARPYHVSPPLRLYDIKAVTYREDTCHVHRVNMIGPTT